MSHSRLLRGFFRSLDRASVIVESVKSRFWKCLRHKNRGRTVPAPNVRDLRSVLQLFLDTRYAGIHDDTRLAK